MARLYSQAHTCLSFSTFTAQWLVPTLTSVIMLETLTLYVSTVIFQYYPELEKTTIHTKKLQGKFVLLILVILKESEAFGVFLQ